ncbi:hypothetical protein Tco_0011986 [Tanacetum coccineum]
MVEPEKPLKKKDQIALDEEVALRLHAEEQAELQAKEQEQFSIKEKSRMLVEMIAERKKFFAAQRAAEQRSKPPTKTQIRNKMCAYLKNMATKPPMIVDYKIVKEGKFGYFQLIRADRSSKRYLSMIKMLQNIDREDLETLWKLVKAKHENTRPEDDYERVL